MASRKNIQFRDYCDRVYNELSGMKSRLLGFVKEIEQMKHNDKEMLESHISHFNDMIRTIDWKLEILTKVCPHEWATQTGIERTASIRVDEELSKQEPVAGYVGG